ncbi:hypothetical protein ACQY0O_001343 [Thecaphora frezii]
MQIKLLVQSVLMASALLCVSVTAFEVDPGCKVEVDRFWYKLQVDTSNCGKNYLFNTIVVMDDPNQNCNVELARDEEKRYLHNLVFPINSEATVTVQDMQDLSISRQVTIKTTGTGGGSIAITPRVCDHPSKSFGCSPKFYQVCIPGPKWSIDDDTQGYNCQAPHPDDAKSANDATSADDVITTQRNIGFLSKIDVENSSAAIRFLFCDPVKNALIGELRDLDETAKFITEPSKID